VLRRAGDLGRRYGRAAVYWQVGDSGTDREFCQELLRGIASADPAVTGLYEVPDLTALLFADPVSASSCVSSGPDDLTEMTNAFWDSRVSFSRSLL